MEKGKYMACTQDKGLETNLKEDWEHKYKLPSQEAYKGTTISKKKAYGIPWRLSD